MTASHPAQLALDRSDWSAAEAIARERIGAGDSTTEDLLVLAQALNGQRRRAEAISILEPLTASASPEVLPRVYDLLSAAFISVTRLADAEAVLVRALELRREPELLARLAEVRLQDGRAAEAAEAAAEALALDPTQPRVRGLLAALDTARTSRSSRGLARFPKRLDAFADAGAVIRESLLAGYPTGRRFIRPDTKFVTMGSCFARNLAEYLRTRGYQAFNELIGEDVNNTYANRYFLEWVLDGSSNATTAAMEAAYGREVRTRMRQALEECEVFVFSLGVAASFFDSRSGDFVFANTHGGASLNLLLKHCVMRTTSVQENTDNLRAIIASVNALSRTPPAVVLTVSPVPLAATSERASAVMADCISKSTLRLACEEVLQAKAGNEIHYWPSFEMVRWLGPYLTDRNSAVFGAEDGKTRHVSNWMVQTIMDLFVETYSAEPAA